jgi:hypothetical protein
MLNPHQMKMARKNTERAIYYSEHSWAPELSEAFRKMVQTSRNTGKPHTHATETKRRLGL